jgi:hypothetical protein
MKTLATIAVVWTLTWGWAGAASAHIYSEIYDFTEGQYAADFTDVRRGAQINDGAPDLGGTGQPALNVTGRVGAAGDTWLTKWTPGGAPIALDGRCTTLVGGGVLIRPFDNRKGAGFVALLNDAHPGDKGLAVILYDNGNTDALQLATIDPFTGKLTRLATAPLGGAIRENAWYVVFMELAVELAYDGDRLVVDAAVLSLQDPTDPNSDFDQLLGIARFRGLLEETGLASAGQVGIVASAVSAVVDSSITQWLAAEGFEGPCSD